MHTEKKRDWVAVLLETICWIALMGAEFFFLFSFLPWKLLWVFLTLTLLILVFALGRRKLSKRKIFLRITGVILAAFSLVTGWGCFSNASQAFSNLWCTEDLAHYNHLKGGPFPTEESKWDIFPYPIPEYASEIKFQHSPHIMQGGSILSLEFRAPREEIEKWEAFFKEKADYPGSYLDQGLTAKDMAALLGYSAEFKVYVIYAKDSLGEDNPVSENILTQNHGKIYYGAVNYDTEQVFFYKSSW